MDNQLGKVINDLRGVNEAELDETIRKTQSFVKDIKRADIEDNTGSGEYADYVETNTVRLNILVLLRKIKKLLNEAK